jgi:hypothetical protein
MVYIVDGNNFNIQQTISEVNLSQNVGETHQRWRI